jgi:hypothetical protein
LHAASAALHAGSFELVLLLDAREKPWGGDPLQRTGLQELLQPLAAGLRGLGAAVEVASLKLEDVTWVARGRWAGGWPGWPQCLTE